MIRSRVTSNPFRSVAYDPASRTLEVEYNNGRRYQLQGITPDTHFNLVNADSVGTFYNKNIRGNYKTQELAPRRSTKSEYEEPEND